MPDRPRSRRYASTSPPRPRRWSARAGDSGRPRRRRARPCPGPLHRHGRRCRDGRRRGEHRRRRPRARPDGDPPRRRSAGGRRRGPGARPRGRPARPAASGPHQFLRRRGSGRAPRRRPGHARAKRRPARPGRGAVRRSGRRCLARGWRDHPGRRARLLLANPTPAPAVVDVRLAGPKGPVDVPSGRGLVVAPGRVRAVLLDAAAPGLGQLAVHVVARSGRVTSLLHDSWLRGAVPAGTDDVLPSAAPSRHVVVPGVVVLPGGAARLRVAATGSDDAVVRYHLLGPAGDVAAAQARASSPCPRAASRTCPCAGCARARTPSPSTPTRPSSPQPR